MWSAASVLVCALSLLGRGPETLPPIEFVELPPPGVSPQAEAYTLLPSPTIYLITSSPLFRAAQRSLWPCTNFDVMKRLASVIVHEEWHVRHGSDERGAYEAQLMALAMLGSGASSALYEGVRRSMYAALGAQKRSPSSR